MKIERLVQPWLGIPNAIAIVVCASLVCGCATKIENRTEVGDSEIVGKTLVTADQIKDPINPKYSDRVSDKVMNSKATEDRTVHEFGTLVATQNSFAESVRLLKEEVDDPKLVSTETCADYFENINQNFFVNIPNDDLDQNAVIVNLKNYRSKLIEFNFAHSGLDHNCKKALTFLLYQIRHSEDEVIVKAGKQLMQIPQENLQHGLRPGDLILYHDLTATADLELQSFNRMALVVENKSGEMHFIGRDHKNETYVIGLNKINFMQYPRILVLRPINNELAMGNVSAIVRKITGKNGHLQNHKKINIEFEIAKATSKYAQLSELELESSYRPTLEYSNWNLSKQIYVKHLALENFLNWANMKVVDRKLNPANQNTLNGLSKSLNMAIEQALAISKIQEDKIDFRKISEKVRLTDCRSNEENSKFKRSPASQADSLSSKQSFHSKNLTCD